MKEGEREKSFITFKELLRKDILKVLLIWGVSAPMGKAMTLLKTVASKSWFSMVFLTICTAPIAPGHLKTGTGRNVSLFSPGPPVKIIVSVGIPAKVAIKAGIGIGFKT